MCISTPRPPDTSAADAERQRQYDEDRRREEEQRAASEAEAARQAEEERIAREAWEEEQRQIQRAEEDRQRNEDLNRQAQEAEAERLAQVRSADIGRFQADRAQREATLRSQIDAAFAPYNDSYFDTFIADYIAAQRPQIARQAQEAERSQILDLAQRGNLDSTARAARVADVAGQRANAEAQLAREAQNAAASYRQSVLAQRRSLLDQALSASVLGDPGQVPEDLVGALTQIDERIAAFTPTIAASASAVQQPSSSSIAGLIGQASQNAPADAPSSTATTTPRANQQQAQRQRSSLYVVN